MAPRILKNAVSRHTRVGASHVLDPLVGCPSGGAMQWYRNGAVLPGATNATLAFPSLHIADNGVYSLHVTASNNVAVSTPVHLVVEPTHALAGWPDLSVDFEGGPIGPASYVSQLVALPDNRMIVAGLFTNFGKKKTGSLVVLDASGRIDPKTEGGVFCVFRVNTVTTNRDGRIMVGGDGWFHSKGGESRSGIARLLPDFRIDPTFDAELPPNPGVTDIVELENGQYLVGGRLGTGPSGTPLTLVVLEANGRRNAEWRNVLAPNESARRLFLLEDRRVFLATEFRNGGSLFSMCFRYLLPSGMADPSIEALRFPESSSSVLPSIHALGDNSVAVAGVPGTGNAFASIPAGAAIYENGKVKPLYERPIDGPQLGLNCIAQDEKGRLLVGEWEGVYRLAKGRIDPSFRTRTDSTVFSMATDSSGGVYIGGHFTKVWDVPRPKVARIYGEDHFQPYLVGPFRSERGLQLKLDTHEGWLYDLEVADNPASGSWSTVACFVGKGGEQVLEDGDAPGERSFYRIRVHRPPDGTHRQIP